MPPKPNPTLYSISKTFVWFGLISLLLTASLAAIVMTDYKREWKDWQKKFMKLKSDKAQAELKMAEGKIDKARLEELTKQQAAAEKAVQGRRDDLKALEREIGRLSTEASKVKKSSQNGKQFEDSYRYYYEEYASHHDSRAAEYKKKLDEIRPKVAADRLELEKLEKQLEAKEKEREAILAESKRLEKEIENLYDEKRRADRKLESAKPSVVKDVLNAPMLDFIAPTLEVQQIVLDNLYDDYHFAKAQKVDRCTTCHLGIDQKGFEDAPQPFKTHPKMELYLGADSPHPVEKFGCTTCHSGNGHSVSFKDSAHTPSSKKQAEEWAKKYNWKELEKWEHKMLPKDHVQASCSKCHHGAAEVPQADKLNRGRKIAETHGCMNCHKIDGFENRYKVGPDLRNVKTKLDGDWIARWVDDPRDFRPKTQMPRVFHLTNTSSPEDVKRNHAAIHSISAYLMKHSGEIELKQPPVKGNAGNGEKLVKTVGCTGCHTVAGVEINSFGPDLNGLGSKVTEKWLFNWLKDPKHLADTRMPSLRLSDQEAADIAAYLLAQKNEKFEAKKLPAADPKVVDAMILENLQGTLRRSEAEAKLNEMSPEMKLEFLGQKTIAHQGCYTCHQIKGFEDAKPIGADLSNEGAKDIHQFDFGFVHNIGHTRHDWINQKIKDPRIFDLGKEKAYYEKLRMPQFNFSEEEIDALTTFVLSLTQEQIPLEMQKRLDSKDLETEKGRLLVSQLNCVGCHTLDGKEGALRLNAEDPGSVPPTLIDEGAKVQEDWLHTFLAHPTTIRPWLTYRMPTFGFDEEELRTMVHYFAHLNEQTLSYQGHPTPKSTPEKIEAGRALVEKLQCEKCHQVSAESAAMGTSFLAPDLNLTKNRLKPEWVKDWVADPQKLEPGTMMPAFFTEGEPSPITDVLEGDAGKQIEAIRDYLFVYQKGDAKASPQDDSSKNLIANTQ